MQGVSKTALWVASMRATEAARPDRLHSDPLASAFVAASGAGPLGAPPGAAEFLAIRTRFYDDFLTDALAPQVVLLAAGLDSRAFRLSWPSGTSVFELDLPELLSFKETVVAASELVPACSRVVVPVDLRSDWASVLLAAGFSPTLPTAWVAEGLMQYLSAAENDRLLATISSLSVPGSMFAFDHMETAASQDAVVAEVSARVREMGASFASGLDDPGRWLASHGWTSSTVRVPALALAYGRPLPDYVDLTAANLTALCTATMA